jgi:CheY-like chemotaxis protein
MDARDRALPTAEVTTERQPRILVIDDDRYVRMLLADVLSAWGYEADVVADGTEGLALFGRGGAYDVVLTDLAMPNMNGLDVAARVRDRDPSVAVILFTAFTGELGDEDRRLRFRVLRKPLDIDDLHRALRDTLTGSASA